MFRENVSFVGSLDVPSCLLSDGLVEHAVSNNPINIEALDILNVFIMVSILV